MIDIPPLHSGPLVDASLELVRSTESQPIVGHSIRTLLFARLLAEGRSRRPPMKETA